MEWLLSGTPAVYLTAIGFLVFMLLVAVWQWVVHRQSWWRMMENRDYWRETAEDRGWTTKLRTQALEHAEEKVAMLEKELGVLRQVKPLDIGKGY